ncbi:hypothetical protein [Lysobacter sp. HA18]
MFAELKRWWKRIWHEETRSIQVPLVDTLNLASVSGIKPVADFYLQKGRWIVFAKGTAVGSGGNDRQVDLRLKVVGNEGDVTQSDESYGTASPLLGTTMTAILPFDVASSAHFQVNVAAQGGQAEFSHIVVVAVREP